MAGTFAEFIKTVRVTGSDADGTPLEATIEVGSIVPALQWHDDFVIVEAGNGSMTFRVPRSAVKLQELELCE